MPHRFVKGTTALYQNWRNGALRQRKSRQGFIESAALVATVARSRKPAQIQKRFSNGVVAPPSKSRRVVCESEDYPACICHLKKATSCCVRTAGAGIRCARSTPKARTTRKRCCIGDARRHVLRGAAR